MNTAFVLSGLMILAGVIATFQGIREMKPGARRVCCALLALTPIGSIIAGIFTLEAGFLHFVGFLAAVGGAVLGFPALGLVLRRIPSWRRFGGWLLWGDALTLVLLVWFFATFDPTGAGANVGVSGLVQRVLVTEIHAWYAALGWLAFRRA